jgi:hypothetical protein
VPEFIPALFFFCDRRSLSGQRQLLQRSANVHGRMHPYRTKKWKKSGNKFPHSKVEACGVPHETL